MPEKSSSIPRIIWCVWVQGWEKAPRLVKACVRTWQRHNPDWTINFLDMAGVWKRIESPSLLHEYRNKGMRVQAWNNLIRTELLARYGGVWVDATTYCLKPLNDWIDDVTPAGFFAFNRPAKSRMLSNWFLASEPDSYIIRTWRAYAYDYWRQKTGHYERFWHHNIFEAAYQADGRFRDLWDRTPKISADGPHFYMPYGTELIRRPQARDQRLIENAAVPLLKLTVKTDPRLCGEGSVYDWLCSLTEHEGFLPA